MKKYILIVKSLNYFVVQNFLGYHYSVIYKKLHKHSHWGTQETLTVTQETVLQGFFFDTFTGPSKTEANPTL